MKKIVDNSVKFSISVFFIGFIAGIFASIYTIPKYNKYTYYFLAIIILMYSIVYFLSKKIKYRYLIIIIFFPIGHYLYGSLYYIFFDGYSDFVRNMLQDPISIYVMAYFAFLYVALFIFVFLILDFGGFLSKKIRKDKSIHS